MPDAKITIYQPKRWRLLYQVGIISGEPVYQADIGVAHNEADETPVRILIRKEHFDGCISGKYAVKKGGSRGFVAISDKDGNVLEMKRGIY